MGCAASRDEIRQDQFGQDYNTVPYAFKVTDNENYLDLHPYDKVVIAWLNENKGDFKEAADGPLGDCKEGKFSKPEPLKAGATKLFNDLKAQHAAITKNADEAKEKCLFAKYGKKAALEDIDGVLKLIGECFDDLKWPEAEAAPAAEGEKPKEGEEEKKEEVAAEGGDKPEFPANIVKAYHSHPFFADQVKSFTMCKELLPAFNFLNPTASLAKVDWTFGLMGEPIDFAFCASVIFMYVNSQEKKGKDEEVWFTAKLTDTDKEELAEALANKEKKAVIFPGVIQVFADQAEADGKCIMTDGEKAKNKVTVKYTAGNYFEAAEKIMLVARFNAQITEEKDGVYTITDAAASFETVKAWGEKAGQAVAGAASGAAAAATDDKKEEAPVADAEKPAE